MQQRLDALPLPLLFLVFALVAGVLGYLLGVLTGNGAAAMSLAWRCLLFAAVLTWLAARARRRSGAPGAAPAIGAAVRSGTLPVDADPGAWRPVLEGQRRSALRARRVGPVVFGTLAVVSIVFAVLLGSAGWWLIAAAWAVLGALSPLGSARNVRRLDALLGQLDARPGDGRG